MTDLNLECLNEGPDCSGPIEFHRMPNAERAFPRCERHWSARLDAYEGSLEQEAQSPLAPSWFDPADAGERWDDDY